MSAGPVCRWEEKGFSAVGNILWEIRDSLLLLARPHGGCS